MNTFKKLMIQLLYILLGRRNCWRAGRALYLMAKMDTINDLKYNGELIIQKKLLMKFSDGQELNVFDIGANRGEWTYSLLIEAYTTNQLKITAFEPMPFNTSIFLSKISQHPLKHFVHLEHKALSNINGKANIFFPIETDGQTCSLHPDPLDPHREKLNIELVTLDYYCSINKIETIHFLKCDTEGHDFEVICGAKKLFDEQKIMAFQFEYNGRWVYSRHYLKDVFDLFFGTVYKIGKITPKGIELYQEWTTELEHFFHGNYILLHPEAVNWFPTITGEFDQYGTYRVKTVNATELHHVISV
jgi:FkbM family methyltransferase